MNDSDSSPNQVWLARAFEELEIPLMAYTTHLLNDAHRASDVVQDAFVRLCSQPREKIEGNERQWLYKVCRNRAFDILKKEGRMKTLDDGALVQESSDCDPARKSFEQEAAEQAGSLLTDLPARQQEVIRLKVQSGLSYREISELTGLSVSNVGYLLHTGLKSIRSRMANID